MKKTDKAAYQKRLDRIADLFSGMVAQAEVQSRHRCPYRNRHDQCTAKFRCRNQRPPAADDDPAICAHDAELEYRSAWETDPSNYRRAKAKIKKIKTASLARRGRQDPGETGD